MGSKWPKMETYQKRLPSGVLKHVLWTLFCALFGRFEALSSLKTALNSRFGGHKRVKNGPKWFQNESKNGPILNFLRFWGAHACALTPLNSPFRGQKREAKRVQSGSENGSKWKSNNDH